MEFGLKNIPLPPKDGSFIYPVFTCGCACGIKRKERKDCYFYHEEHDMGATVPCCSYYGGYGNCPCEGCTKYFPQADAFKIIKERVDSETR